MAGSAALFGFGLNTFVESFSGWVMVLRFWRFGIGSEDETIAGVERQASRLVA